MAFSYLDRELVVPLSGWLGGAGKPLLLGSLSALVLAYLVREQDSTAETPRELVLDRWLQGADEPDPIKSLGIRIWRPSLPPVLAELDPKGPAQAAGLKTGDRLLALDGRSAPAHRGKCSTLLRI